MFVTAAQDQLIHRRVGELIDEEQALRGDLASALAPHRLEGIAADLDQCWDLLCERHERSTAEGGDGTGGPE